MRTVYLKNNYEIPFSFPYYWKVVQVNEEECSVVTVTSDSIEVGFEEDFFEHVHFIKTTHCSETGCVEIEKEEFEEQFRHVKDLIDKVMNL